MSEALRGQVAIVTGGSRGIGLAIATALATEGVAVALVARSREAVEAAARNILATGAGAIPLAADVTDQGAVAWIVEETVRQLGPIDLLVNNAGAGSTAAVGPVWDVDPEVWWRDVATNLRGSFLCARAVLPGMLARHRGRILNVVSGLGIHTHPESKPTPYASAYSSSKAATIVLTENLAAMTQDHGVRVFALRPGFVRTKLTEEGAQSTAGRQWLPEFQAMLDSDRLVPPERAARWAVFLASGEADDLSGRVFNATHDSNTLGGRSTEIRREGKYLLRLCE